MHGIKTKTYNAAQASSSDDAPVSPISAADARKVLGLGDNASFEQTVKAKNRLLAEAGQDNVKQMQVDTLPTYSDPVRGPIVAFESNDPNGIVLLIVLCRWTLTLKMGPAYDSVDLPLKKEQSYLFRR